MIDKNYRIVGGFNADGVAVCVIERVGDDEFYLEVFNKKTAREIVDLFEKDVKQYIKKYY